MHGGGGESDNNRAGRPTGKGGCVSRSSDMLTQEGRPDLKRGSWTLREKEKREGQVRLGVKGAEGGSDRRKVGGAPSGAFESSLVEIAVKKGKDFRRKKSDGRKSRAAKAYSKKGPNLTRGTKGHFVGARGGRGDP